jgi:hypothetical protein
MTDFQPKPQTPEQVDEGLRNAFKQAMKDGVMDATPYLKQMTFNTDIEKTEAEIKVLQKKLELLKEIETYKSPVENAYKVWWGQYPELETDSKYDDTRWKGFKAGFQAAYEEKVREDDYYNDVVDEPYRNVKAYWDEKDNPASYITDEVVNKLIREHQAQKLRNMLKVQLDYDGMVCDDIVDIVEDWLPKEQSAAGSQNVDTELLVDGFNHCLRKIKEMLR